MDGRATFEEDVKFLGRHTNVVVLADPGGRGKIAVSTPLQGRVMTSSVAGDPGTSLGWINRPLFTSGTPQPHIHAYGGEDRFWLGPEGGQFSIFFPPGVPFEYAHWRTPPPIDTLPYRMDSLGPTSISCSAEFSVTNYSGQEFQLRVDREVSIVSRARAGQILGVPVPEGVAMIAHQSDNRITNLGEEAWTPRTGMLSVWILGMFHPSPRTTVVLPYRKGDPGELGPVFNDAYFGPIPPHRLVDSDGVLYFRGDGQERGKIGLSPRRARPVIGSWDPDSGILTLVQYDQPPHAVHYMNSLWEIQDEPFAGDAVNSYNDGPPVPGADPLGPFYELESSSPAASLMPEEFLSHVHRTFHFQGRPKDLERVARATLGVGFEVIEQALPDPDA